MFRYFINKINSIKFSLRFCVVFVLIAFIVIAFSIILPIIYLRLSKDFTEVSYRFMRQISSEAFYRINDEMKKIEIAGQFSDELINTKVVAIDNEKEFVNFLVSVMKVETQMVESVQSVFWGDEAGNFIMAEKQRDGTMVTEILNRTIHPYIHKISLQNENGEIISTKVSKDLSYDPRTRPWYQAAKMAKKPVWTEVYPYRVTQYLGTTFTTPIYKNSGELKGVFILNVRIDFLTHFLENIKITKHGVVFVVQDDGKVVAFPGVSQHDLPALRDIASFGLPWLTKSFEEFKRNGKNEFAMDINGEQYLSVYKQIQNFGSQKCYIAVVVPENDFVGDMSDVDEITIWISCAILLMGVVIVYFFLARVMSQMNLLIKETEKIKNFDLDGASKLTSRVKEISHLANAIDNMKKGLRSFQKYVPASLVRQLIETGEDVRVGGVRKNLAIFFSDIKDFTSISEHADPGKLTTHVCEYFEDMSKIIVGYRGTIDKYIGDSIMAIWGAPQPELSACRQAAKAAIECQRQLGSLNAKWKAQGRPEFLTRIGLHTGIAVVGNVGSTERVSYTAIGDVINIASRLEGLNKLYGTQIMVSEDFYHEVKDEFVFRPVDHVTVKGKEVVSFVYELLAENYRQLNFDLDSYLIYFTKAFSSYQKQSWDDAIEQFRECMRIHPHDKLAYTFIKRCKHFKKKPPAEDWDGVWHVSGK